MRKNTLILYLLLCIATGFSSAEEGADRIHEDKLSFKTIKLESIHERLVRITILQVEYLKATEEWVFEVQIQDKVFASLESISEFLGMIDAEGILLEGWDGSSKAISSDPIFAHEFIPMAKKLNLSLYHKLNPNILPKSPLVTRFYQRDPGTESPREPHESGDQGDPASALTPPDTPDGKPEEGSPDIIEYP